MEKINFGAYQFNLIPMGVSEDISKKTRTIKFISELNQSEVYSIVADPNNFNLIIIVGEDGVSQITYSDCINIKGMSFLPDSRWIFAMYCNGIIKEPQA